VGEQFDAAVVGSGPNGLAAAITLAQAGRSVVVLEAAETVGGSARTAALTLPGFRHDVCSAIHPMGVGSPFLSGLPLGRYGLRWIHPPASMAHPLEGRPAALQVRSVRETAASLGEDEAAWVALFEPLVARWGELIADALGPLGVPGSPLLLARFGLRAMLPATALARRLRGERARALFAGVAAHSVLPLERSPSAAIGLMLAAAGHAVGWPLPEGGAQSLSDALAAHLRALGGQIRTGAPVRSLAEVPTAGPILFNTAPRTLLEIAGDALPALYRRRLARYRYGPGVFKLDWALDGPIPWADPTVARAGTVHLGGTLEQIAAAERAVWRGEHPERPYVLLAQQSLFDPSRAPAGRHTGWAYCHVPRGSDRDRAEAIEATVERYAPGFRDRILARHAMSAVAFERYNANYVGGDVNGGAADLDQLFTRPVARINPYTTPNPRLFLCSAATPPGGGVHGMSGYYAARAAIS
jgi:phytoene dehydrogenase-like protein